MIVHFAYGSNMSRALMQRRCPEAVALGTARLDGWRYVIMREGYASLTPMPGAAVHGVLWRLSPRDLTALNAYESLDSGLYRRRMLPVQRAGHRVQALVYLARTCGEGRPRPGYQAIVVEAARVWNLPAAYVRSLERWLPSGLRGARAVETGETA